MDVCRKTLCGTLRFPSSPLNPRSLLIVLSGLPGSGKTAIATSLKRYLQWINQNVEIFNAGSLRRDHGYFGQDPSDFNDVRSLEDIADSVLDTIMAWFRCPVAETSKGASHSSKIRGGTAKIAIFDATNSTYERRQKIIVRAHESCIQVLFVESHLPTLTLEQFRITKWMNHAASDYVNFINAERAYESFLTGSIYIVAAPTHRRSLQEDSLSFIRIHDRGTTVSLVDGYLP